MVWPTTVWIVSIEQQLKIDNFNNHKIDGLFNENNSIEQIEQNES